MHRSKNGNLIIFGAVVAIAGAFLAGRFSRRHEAEEGKTERLFDAGIAKTTESLEKCRRVIMSEQVKKRVAAAIDDAEWVAGGMVAGITALFKPMR